MGGKLRQLGMGGNKGTIGGGRGGAAAVAVARRGNFSHAKRPLLNWDWAAGRTSSCPGRRGRRRGGRGGQQGGIGPRSTTGFLEQS